MNPASTLKAVFAIKQVNVQLSAGRPVRIQKLDVTGDVAAHDHDYYEISVVRALTHPGRRVQSGARRDAGRTRAPEARTDFLEVQFSEVPDCAEPRVHLSPRPGSTELAEVSPTRGGEK